MNPTIERFQGAMLGLALGEAFGLPHAGVAPGKLERPRDLDLPRGRLPRGQYGAGTQTALALGRSLLERDGFDGADFAERLTDLYRDNRIIGHTEQDREAVNRLLVGQADWTYSGSPMGRVSVVPALRAVPLGLLFCSKRGSIGEAASRMTRVTHKDPRCSAVAAGAAQAISELVTSTQVDAVSLLGKVSEAAGQFEDGIAKAVSQIARWATDRKDLSALAAASAALDKGSPRPDTGEGAHGGQVFLSALIAFLRSGGDFLTCMGTALKAGGDTDLTAGLAGALVGAFGGIGCLPRDLAAVVTDRGQDSSDAILDVADGLYRVRYAGG